MSGGTFYRSYDAVIYTDNGFPATVSEFRLDKYEVTVGRFRNFVDAWDGGWRPSQGAGKHAHLNGGSGLSDSVGYESGWSTGWAANIATNAASWDSNLSCISTFQNWTSTPGTNERRPINCESWYEAYAFCIWDGGFLPSEAEWNYAAAGGSEQRAYPWSSPPTSNTIDCTYANFENGTTYCVSPPNGSTNDVGSESPLGDGKWGQADLAGNVWEWNIDSYAQTYSATCDNCAHFQSSADGVVRGGGFDFTAAFLLAADRSHVPPGNRSRDLGVRCARTP